MTIATIRSLLQSWPRTYRAARAIYGRCHPLIERRNELQIRRLLQAKVHDLDQVCFIQVGANDGLRCDLLHQVILQDARWHGVMLEPVPYLYEQLCRNLAPISNRLVFKQLAASDEARAAKFYYLPEAMTYIDGRRLPDHRHGLGSFNPNHVARHFGPELKPHLLDQTLQTITLKQLCAELQLGRVDVLVIDVEGHECHVLRGFDFETYQPRAVLYEHRHLAVAARHEAIELLRCFGYVSRLFGSNTLAIRTGS